MLPPSDPSCTCRVRIFTPRQELPFAGHPTLGTAAVLARRNGAQAARQFVFEEGIGPVTVTVDGPEISLHLRSPRYQATDEAPPAAAGAKALTLHQDEITECWYAGVGPRFCFVRLAGRDLVDRAVLDKGAWAAGIAVSWSGSAGLISQDLRPCGRIHRVGDHTVTPATKQQRPARPAGPEKGEVARGSR